MAEKMTSADGIRTIMPQVEHFLGSFEAQNPDDDATLDMIWSDFIGASMKAAEAHGAIPDVDAKRIEAGLRDNYAHIAFGVLKAIPTDTDLPVIAWAAFNKHRYQGWKDEIGIVRTLALAGYNPNLPDTSSKTPLHLMAYQDPAPHSSPRGVRLLLDAGAEVDARNARGDTPLMLLAASGAWTEATHNSAIKLLEAGADPFAKADDSETPLSVMKQCQKANPSGARQAIIDHIEQNAG